MHSADGRRNRHAVIVENDENIRVENAQAVERLIHQAVIEGAVADKGDNVVILLFQVARFGYAQRRRNGRPRMSRVVAVVLALLALGKA